jgi:hypothetical protein
MKRTIMTQMPQRRALRSHVIELAPHAGLLAETASKP